MLSKIADKRKEEMDAKSVKGWVEKEIFKKGFNGACGIASFSEVYNDLMPVQRRAVEKICGDDIDVLLRKGSIVSIAIFHTENAIKSIGNTKDGKIDYERWNIYAEEYNIINNALNEICTKLASLLDGVVLKATLELDREVHSVEDYYSTAKISHRVVAEHAGIGARGKSELIVTKQNGSAVRFASFIAPENLDRDKKVGDLCGDCTACLDSCGILKRKEKLKNYRQQCMKKINVLNLRYDVCGICVKACYESGNWRKHSKHNA